MSEYLDEHPFLDFRPDFSRLPHTAWILLGEAKSKCEHIAGVPLKPAVASQLHKIYLAKGVQATTAIEGNTLTEEEVRRRIDDDLPLPKSKAYLGQEVDNILVACNSVLRGDISLPLKAETLHRINRVVLNNLELDEEVTPGRLRSYTVGVGRYRAPNARYCPELVDRFCEWVNRAIESAPEDGRVEFGILTAIAAHLYLVWIHPYGDGNGRTARLIEHLILLEVGVPTPAAHVLSNHYNETRSRYYLELDKAGKRSDISSFVEYSLQGLVDQLKQQLSHIKAHQHRLAWESFVYERFAGATTPASARQRRLVLSLPDGVATPRARVPALTTQLAADYAGKTSRTVQRDLNALMSMGLVVKVKGGYRALTEIISAFLPIERELLRRPPSRRSAPPSL